MHEKTLKYALSGGPMPSDCRAHLDGCDSCRVELEALRKIEGELAEAAPRFSDERSWTEGLTKTLLESSERDGAILIRGPSRWFRAAALGAMAAGFVAAMALLTGGPVAPAPSPYLAANGSASIVEEAGWESSYLPDSDDVYTTTALLTGAETIAASYESGGDEVDILANTTNGGSWNG